MQAIPCRLVSELTPIIPAVHHHVRLLAVPRRGELVLVGQGVKTQYRIVEVAYQSLEEQERGEPFVFLKVVKEG